MSKRKNIDIKYEALCKKVTEIEKELLQSRPVSRRRRIISSSSCSSEDNSTQQCSEIKDHEILSPGIVPNSNDVALMDDAMDAHAEMPIEAEISSAATQAIQDIDPPTQKDNETINETNTNKYGKDLQKDLAVRFEYIATTGVTKETCKELTEKYLVPENFRHSEAPSLNLEVKAALSEVVIKHDKAIETKQKITAAAISSRGEAITYLLMSKNKEPELLRLLCDSQHNDSLTRRNYVTTSVKKEMKESLQNTKIDGFLFGSNLSDTLKTAKAINKSGAELKALPIMTAFNKNVTPTTSKNWKSHVNNKVNNMMFILNNGSNIV